MHILPAKAMKTMSHFRQLPSLRIECNISVEYQQYGLNNQYYNSLSIEYDTWIWHPAAN